MNRVMAIWIEMAVFLAIYLGASVLTRSIRKRCEEDEGKPAGFFSCVGHCLAFPLRPLAVLAITEGVAWFMRWVLGWTTPFPDHLTAWLYFWELAVLVALVEGCPLQFYRLRGKPFPVPDLLRNIVRGVLLIVAGFMVLHLKLDINIAPLLGASALVTAVVGFALQGVLGNLLAGMSLHVVGAVAPGDWVAIGDIEGEVTQTNWRETRLRTVAGHIIIVPNSTVSSATLHNMSRPTPLRRHSIPVGASYSDAPGDVIAALIESAKTVPDVLKDPAPSACLVEYKDFGINYVLRFWTNQYHNRTVVEGDVMRTIWYQFKRRGIEIPFPMSDKIINDVVEVIDHRRRQLPDEAAAKRTVNDLMQSDFFSRLLVDEAGAPLLRPEQLMGIASSIRRIRYTQGETIFRQGESGESCYVVVQGRAHGRVEYKDAAQANEFDLVAGALFGEMSLVTGLPRTATVSANEELELLEISKETFTTLLGMREDIPQILSKLVAQRAEQNRAILEKLQAMGSVNLQESIQPANILQRFLRMLGKK